MKILIINSGSSSIKFQIINMPTKVVICKGMVERIGLHDAQISLKFDGHSISDKLPIPNHEVALDKMTAFLTDNKLAIINNTDAIDAVAHRVVHGGNRFDKPILIDKEAIAEIERLASLAPLHNPANVKGIKVSMSIFKKARQVAVFDTAFHQTLPEKSYRYAIPRSLADQHHIRVYGFHGTSHKYVTQKAIDYLKAKSSKIISIHLGNGCSITAVKDGESIDHSLGFGPSNGLIMGTRSGDIDQSVIFYLMDDLGMTSKEVNQLLQKQSGLLGLTGRSDLREVQVGAEKGQEDCDLAIAMMAYRIKKFIGSYYSVLNGVDAIVFTAGIGENSSLIREMVCKDMGALGLHLDTERNSVTSSDILEIQSDTSKIKILVIPTNEELEIAEQTYHLLN